MAVPSIQNSIAFVQRSNLELPAALEDDVEEPEDSEAMADTESGETRPAKDAEGVWR